MNRDIQVMELDLIEDQFFHIEAVDGQNVIIFGADMSSSTKIDNRKKYILILCKGSIDTRVRTYTTAEKMY